MTIIETLRNKHFTLQKSVGRVAYDATRMPGVNMRIGRGRPLPYEPMRLTRFFKGDLFIQSGIETKIDSIWAEGYDWVLKDDKEENEEELAILKRIDIAINLKQPLAPLGFRDWARTNLRNGYIWDDKFSEIANTQLGRESIEIINLDSETWEVDYDEYGNYLNFIQRAIHYAAEPLIVPAKTGKEGSYIVHHNNRSYGSEIYGNSSLIAVLRSSSAILLARKFLASQYLNNLPMGYFIYPNSNPTQRTQLQQEIDARRQDFHKFMVMEGDIEFKPIDIETMNVPEHYWTFIQEILVGIRVPPIAIGLPTLGGKGSGGTTMGSDVSLQFYAENIRNDQKNFEDYWNHMIMPFLKIQNYKLKINNSNLRDKIRKSEISKRKAESGAFTINSIVEEVGDKPYDGGADWILLKSGELMHIEDLKKTPEELHQEKLRRMSEFGELQTQQMESRQTTNEQNAQQGGSQTGSGREEKERLKLDQIKKKDQFFLTQEEALIYDEIDQDINKAKNSILGLVLITNFESLLPQEVDKVIALAGDRILLPLEESIDKSVQTVFMDEINKIKGINQLGTKFTTHARSEISLLQKDIKEGYFINDQKWQGAGQIVKDLQNNVREAFRKGFTSGDKGIVKQEVKKAIDHTVNRFKTLSRTESLRVSERAKFLGYHQLNYKRKYLRVKHDDRTSDVCKELGALYGSERSSIPIEQPFESGVKGITSHIPPFHPNCRTEVVYIE